MTIEMVCNKGKYKVLLSDCDKDLAESLWTVTGYGYAMNKKDNSYLHRIVLARILSRSLTSMEIADHANCNRLDNRRENLRLATASQNSFNKRLQSNNTSGFRGVTFRKDLNKWAAKIRIENKEVFLGAFVIKEDAAKAWKLAAKELYGKFYEKTV